MSIARFIVNKAITGAKAAAAGLTNFLEARTTATPNATVPAHSIRVTGTETDIDAVFSPKGAGALLAQLPDNSAAGGDKRGTNAVDLQTIRFSSNQVASGVQSVVAGGWKNKATFNLASVGGGESNTASGRYATVPGGYANTASGTGAFAAGSSHSVTGSGSAAALGGEQHTVSGGYSIALGGMGANTRGVTGLIAYSVGYFGTKGDAQTSKILLRNSTTNATQTEMGIWESAPSSTYSVTIPSSSSASFIAHVIARSSTGVTAAWEVKGVFKRATSSASVAFIGTPSVSLIAADTGASAWEVNVGVNTSVGALAILVTGGAATNIRWVAEVQTVEVGY